MKFTFKFTLYFYFLLFFTLLCTPLFAAGSIESEVAHDISSQKNNVSGEILAPATTQQVNDLMSVLTDAQARDLLKKRLEEEVHKELQAKAAQEDQHLLNNVAEIGRHILDIFARAPQALELLQHVYNRFVEGQTKGFIFLFTFWFLLILTIAWLIESWLTSQWKQYQSKKSAQEIPSKTTLKSTVSTLWWRFFSNFIGVAIFFGIVTFLIDWQWPRSSFENVHLMAMTLLRFVAIGRVAYLIAQFFLSPKYPELRLLHFDDQSAIFSTRCIVFLALVNHFPPLNQLIHAYGLSALEREVHLGFWFSTSFYIGMIYFFWRCRVSITNVMTENYPGIGKTGLRFAYLWPYISMALVGAQWFFWEYLHVFQLMTRESTFASHVTVVLVLGFPILDITLRALIVKYWLPILPDASDKIRHIRDMMRRSMLRVGRLSLFVLSILFLSWLWGINLTNLEGSEPQQLVLRGIDIILTLMIAYIVWELVNLYLKKRILEEGGDDAIEEEAPDAEMQGGQGESRVSTILPLLEKTAQTIIIISTIFIILSEAGVNIGPLIAGAGVVGLAIGFGAQTLVKDVVSGMFFLFDDAFRMGEYIDIGGGAIKGTVERISVRSLRLRHHLGPVHTVPYGEIPYLTNYSRDWVIMKLPFLVPHETDLEKVRKLFKKIGQGMLEHPEYGKDFLAPFKSQGVRDVNETAIVVRGKFTCKPGKQFMIRKEIYVRVQRAFKEQGIKFAKNHVVVTLPEKAELDETDQQQVSAAAEYVVQKNKTEQNSLSPDGR